MVKLKFSKKFRNLLHSLVPSLRKNYWNNKWDTQTILYELENGKGYADVRDILNEKLTSKQEELLTITAEELIKYGQKRNYSQDDLMFHIFRFVRRNVTYKGDFSVWKKPEYWQNPGQTIEMRTGDCEDGAILMTELARRCEIPAWKIKIAAGWVQDPKNKFRQIGHAYVVYLRDDWNEWFVLDWCYYENETIQNWYNGKVHKEIEKYAHELWFTFNWKKSWKQKNFEW